MMDLENSRNRPSMKGTAMTRTRMISFALAALMVLGLAPIAEAHYAPDMGRWLSRDPAGMQFGSASGHTSSYAAHATGINNSRTKQYADGKNLYQYVRSSPVRYVDPDGEKAVDWHDLPASDPWVDTPPFFNFPPVNPDVDIFVYTCRPLRGLGRLAAGAVHCAIRCNGVTYSLLNRDGRATPDINPPEDAPGGNFTPRIIATTRGRNMSNGICDCVAQAWALNSRPYSYCRDNCNSNWFVNQIARCCGISVANPGTYANRCNNRRFNCPYSNIGGPRDFVPPQRIPRAPRGGPVGRPPVH